MTYDFSNYICGVNGLTCIGCSLFCRSRKEKLMNREHLIQVAFSIDEDRIIKAMENQLQKKLSDEIETQVKKDLFGDPWDSRGVIKREVHDWLAEHQEEVLDRTAALLVEKIYRTKAVKDMLKAVGEEVKDEGSNSN